MEKNVYETNEKNVYETNGKNVQETNEKNVYETNEKNVYETNEKNVYETNEKNVQETNGNEQIRGEKMWINRMIIPPSVIHPYIKYLAKSVLRTIVWKILQKCLKF